MYSEIHEKEIIKYNISTEGYSVWEKVVWS